MSEHGSSQLIVFVKRERQPLRAGTGMRCDMTLSSRMWHLFGTGFGQSRITIWGADQAQKVRLLTPKPKAVGIVCANQRLNDIPVVVKACHRKSPGKTLELIKDKGGSRSLIIRSLAGIHSYMSSASDHNIRNSN